MKHQALVLKVADFSVVRHFPFEKSYFFKNEVRPKLGNIFRFGLITPITRPLQKMLTHLTTGGLGNKPIQAGGVHAVQRYDQALEAELASYAPIKEVAKSPKDYFMVIPILMRGTKVDLHRTFAYLFPRQAAYTRARISSMQASFSPSPYYDRDTYTKLFKSVHVLFEHEEINKPCVFCRHAISSMAGSCLFGSRTCHKKISFAGSGQFQENIRKYKEIMTNFPDRLKGVDHGSVPDNDD